MRHSESRAPQPARLAPLTETRRRPERRTLWRKTHASRSAHSEMQAALTCLLEGFRLEACP